MDSPFTNFISQAVTSVMGGLNRWVEGFDPFDFSTRYEEVLRFRHAHVKVFGMVRPLDINGIYVDVMALQNIPSRMRETYDDVEKVVRNRHRADYNPFAYQRKPALAVVAETKRLLVLGKPGSGKTTFLQFLVTNLLSAEPIYKAIPVHLSLKAYSDSAASSFVDFITNDLELYCHFPRTTSVPFLERALEDGFCAVLFDGLDEVDTKARSRIIAEIERIAAQYPRASLVVTCRTADYEGGLNHFDEVELADFTSSQVEQFVNGWFADAPDMAARLMAAYYQTPPVAELCEVPLLAALMCLMFSYKLQLPVSRAELYAECIDALLFKWDSSRQISRRSSYENLSSHRKKTLFANVAQPFMEHDRVVFARSELLDVFDRELERFGVADSAAVLDEIARQHAVLVERSAGLWSFMHLTFQEYFTALYYVQNRLEQALVHDHFFDPRWREVLLLTGALLPDADRLVSSIADAIVNRGIPESYRRRISILIAAGIEEDGFDKAAVIFERLLTDRTLTITAFPRVHTSIAKVVKDLGVLSALWSRLTKRAQQGVGSRLVTVNGSIETLFRDVFTASNDEYIDKFFSGLRDITSPLHVLEGIFATDSVTSPAVVESAVQRIFEALLPAGVASQA